MKNRSDFEHGREAGLGQSAGTMEYGRCVQICSTARDFLSVFVGVSGVWTAVQKVWAGVGGVWAEVKAAAGAGGAWKP